MLSTFHLLLIIGAEIAQYIAVMALSNKTYPSIKITNLPDNVTTAQLSYLFQPLGYFQRGTGSSDNRGFLYLASHTAAVQVHNHLAKIGYLIRGKTARVASTHRVASSADLGNDIDNTIVDPSLNWQEAIKELEARIDQISGYYVGIRNISSRTTTLALAELFKSVGSVVRFSFPIDKDTSIRQPYAFIGYASAKAASDAVYKLNGYKLGGQELRVFRAGRDNLHRRGDLEPPSTTSIPPASDDVEKPATPEVLDGNGTSKPAQPCNGKYSISDLKSLATSPLITKPANLEAINATLSSPLLEAPIMAQQPAVSTAKTSATQEHDHLTKMIISLGPDIAHIHRTFLLNHGLRSHKSTADLTQAMAESQPMRAAVQRLLSNDALASHLNDQKADSVGDLIDFEDEIEEEEEQQVKKTQFTARKVKEQEPDSLLDLPIEDKAVTASSEEETVTPGEGGYKAAWAMIREALDGE